MDLDTYLKEIQDKQVAVIGAGISNLPLIQILCEAKISVTVHDKKTAEELGSQYDILKAYGVQFVLGKSYLDNLTEDIIFRTPGLHPRFLSAAKQRGAVITSEMELFFSVCPCKIIGITGSDGKTTTTTLIYEMLKRAGYICHLGGNIGTPLLPQVRQMQTQDIAIVELSSFQLMEMYHSPQIAAITNLSPNHLDYHKDFEEYVQAKTNIYLHQEPGYLLILNADDKVSSELPSPIGSICRHTSMRHTVSDGAYLAPNGMLMLSQHGEASPLLPAKEIRIPGAHNIANMLMAAAVVQDLCSKEAICAVAREFAGVPHRIELVCERNGVKYYNDSIASSPTRTIAGLQSFSQKVILIAGGYDKQIPYDTLGIPICTHVQKLVLTGATAPKIRTCVEQAEYAEKPAVYDATDLAEAVLKASTLASPGDIVILSPASASFDHFKNFAERGNKFKELVQALPQT